MKKYLHINCIFFRMCCLLLLLYGGTIYGQRKMEKLGRGVIATRTATLNTTPVTTTSYVTDAPTGSWDYVYTVKAVDSAGNLSLASNPADIKVSPGEILSSLKVFPNPTQGICWLWFMSQQTGAVKIELYNSNGVLLQTVNDTKSGYFYQRQFNLSSMQKGMYL